MIILNVEELLNKKGKSKTWLCDKMDISHFNLNQAIHRKTSSISFKYLEGFCKYLECNFDELFTFIDDNEDKNN